MPGIAIRNDGESLVVPVKVIPGMQVSSYSGCRAGELLFKIAAAPEKGKANEALERFVAEMLGLPRSAVLVVSGASSRHKKVSVPASSREAILLLAAQEA